MPRKNTKPPVKRTPRKRDRSQATLRQRQQLAGAISTILHSPLCAPRLRQALGDFVCEISTPLLDDSPEIIEMALRRGQCGYGSNCPGAADGSVCAGPETHPKENLRARRVSHATN